jgi:hypothetical protein
LSITPSDPRRAAENAFRHGLKERRDQIRDAGLRFDPRSEAQLQKAYGKGNLLSGLCEGVARFKPPGDPVRLQAMARLMKRGLDTWEHVLIRPGEPWERYVTPEARRGARAAIAEAEKLVPFV